MLPFILNYVEELFVIKFVFYYQGSSIFDYQFRYLIIIFRKSPIQLNMILYVTKTHYFVILYLQFLIIHMIWSKPSMLIACFTKKYMIEQLPDTM